jgi:hypothetical protein
MFSTFFHELAHITNMDIGKYPLFHNPHLVQNEKNNMELKRTAWRAELYTEKIGKILMKYYIPDLTYIPWYTKNPPKWKINSFKERHKDGFFN